MDNRQRGKRTKDAGDSGSTVVELVASLAPPPSESWSDGICVEWAEYWDSDLSKIAASTDVPAVRRCFQYRDLSNKLADAFIAEPSVKGSTGQPKVNPAFDKMLKLAPLISVLEMQIGLTPKARLGLGLDVANVSTRLKSINEAFDKGAAVLDADVLALIGAK